MTRRQLGVMFAGSAVPLAAQGPATEENESPEEQLAQAKKRVGRDSERLHDFALAMDTEPAFVFKP